MISELDSFVSCIIVVFLRDNYFTAMVEVDVSGRGILPGINDHGHGGRR